MAYDAFISRDNTLDFQFNSNELSINHASITKVELIFTREDVAQADVLISSAINTGYMTLDSEKMTLLIPDNSLITAGNYQVQAIVYDSSNTNGIIWGDPIFITAKEI